MNPASFVRDPVTAYLLFTLGVLFVLFELVQPGIGVAGTVGIICLILAGYAFKSLAVPPAVILPAVAVTVLFVVFVLVRAVQARKRRAITGKDALIGRRTVARTDFTPAGKVFLDGAWWNARSDRPLAKGTEVEVTAVEGLLLIVKPTEGR